MTFTAIDLETWPRREHYLAFREMKLTYSATVTIDITDLQGTIRLAGLRMYPTLIWMLTSAANQFREFRTGLDADGVPGVWDMVHPLYTALDDHSKLFSGIWTAYDPDFRAFYDACRRDLANNTTGAYEPQPDVPPNVVNISSLPWVDFTSFNLNMPSDYLLPILTLGQFGEQDGRTTMPLAIQVHHAVCDGYHLGLLVDAVRSLAADASTWLIP